MTKRFQKLLLSVAAIAAFALGGAVFAQAQSSSSTSPPAAHQAGTPSSGAENPNAKDTDNVQSGDQTTPDAPTTRGVAVHKAGATGTEPPSSEQEQPGTETESAPNSDGPGGHADEPGNAGADHQNQGAE
ncbi:MAG: hypothetical protein JWQ48_2909 [Conexibacter sp.]|jgi:hypothetical protein|nr:hypothetical protein [Conexibacter sp.]